MTEPRPVWLLAHFLRKNYPEIGEVGIEALCSEVERRREMAVTLEFTRILLDRVKREITSKPEGTDPIGPEG